MANVPNISGAFRLAAFGVVPLAALGLWAAGCGSAGSADSRAPPPVETRELDVSQMQRTMEPLD